MTNSFQLHASNPTFTTGLHAIKLHAKATDNHASVGVILGRFQKVPVINRGKKHMRRVPDRNSDSQVLWLKKGSNPHVHSDGRVHDASIVKTKGKKGRTLKLLSAPTGDGKFIVHLETGIPQHWDLDSIANFMSECRPESMLSHGSERIDDGSENVITARIKWQRPHTRITGSSDPLNPSKGVRIYSGDAWLMSPGSEILVHDITGKAFRVTCDKNGPKVVDSGFDDPYGKFLSIIESRRDHHAAGTKAAPVGEKPVGIFGSLLSK